MPGSGIQGRKTRRWPAAYARLISATARRVVRSEPSKPRAHSFSWATSARTRPWLRSTHSSSLARYGSRIWSRRTGSAATWPRSRSRTYRATVIGEQPVRRAASRRLPVRSNASRISTTSPACFTTSLLGLTWVGLSNPQRERGGTFDVHGVIATGPWGGLSRTRGRRRSDLVAASVQLRVRLRPDSHGRCQSDRPRLPFLDGEPTAPLGVDFSGYTITYTSGIDRAAGSPHAVRGRLRPVDAYLSASVARHVRWSNGQRAPRHELPRRLP